MRCLQAVDGRMTNNNRVRGKVRSDDSHSLGKRAKGNARDIAINQIIPRRVHRHPIPHIVKRERESGRGKGNKRREGNENRMQQNPGTAVLDMFE